ncbi:hypothetical protein N321_12961 [Antrostomus carolinensis]|uniref:Interleukin n=1 Tax=Antrostomus carolinensis TaxID=279965 RepID=A0A094KY53_ANTCR|nr:hypothetical protein N321_12961 [Antrostomus carolinensis]
MMCKVLIFSCISAVMLMTAAYGAHLPREEESLLKTLIRDLQLLEKSKDKIHLELFTPNEKEECNQQALQCYLTEMDALQYEIKHEDADNLQNIKKNLESLKELIPPGTGCKTCEAHDKKEFPAFHQELSNFLKSMLK